MSGGKIAAVGLGMQPHGDVAAAVNVFNSATVSSQGMLHESEPQVTHDEGYRNKLPELSEQLVTSLSGSICTVKHTPHVGVTT